MRCEGVRGGGEAVTWGGSGGGHTGRSEATMPSLRVLEMRNIHQQRRQCIQCSLKS